MSIFRYTLLALVLLTGPYVHAAETTLSLVDLHGTPRDLAELRGRVVVLNFWATWCVPCREEMPMLARVHREYEQRGVTFVGVSADEEDTRGRIPALLDEASVTFPIWVGGDTLHMERLEVGAALPATVIVDRDGEIAFRLIGPIDEHELRDRLDWLLGPRTRAAPVARVDSFGRYAAEHAKDHADHHDQPAARDDADHDHAAEADDTDHDDGAEEHEGRHADERDHGHAEGEEHQHGVVALEGASLVPS